MADTDGGSSAGGGGTSPFTISGDLPEPIRFKLSGPGGTFEPKINPATKKEMDGGTEVITNNCGEQEGRQASIGNYKVTVEGKLLWGSELKSLENVMEGGGVMRCRSQVFTGNVTLDTYTVEQEEDVNQATIDGETEIILSYQIQLKQPKTPGSSGGGGSQSSGPTVGPGGSGVT